jgi:WD40 repeat protein
MQVLTGMGKEPLTLAFSPDGRLLAAGDGGAFRVWDLSAGPDPLWSVANSSLARYFSFTPDGGHVVGGYYYGLGRYAARTGAKVEDPSLAKLGPTHFAPDGRFALCATPDVKARALLLRCARAARGGWATAWTKEITYNPDYDWSGCRAILFSSDAQRLVRVAARGRAVRNVESRGLEVFDAATGELKAAWVGKLPVYARRGAASPAGAVVLLRERAFYAVDATAPGSEPVKRLNSSPKHFTSVALSRDGTRLATTSNDTGAAVWDTSTWEVRKRYEWKVGRLRTVAFSPDGLRCAAGSDTGQIVVWDVD